MNASRRKQREFYLLQVKWVIFFIFYFLGEYGTKKKDGSHRLRSRHKRNKDTFKKCCLNTNKKNNITKAEQTTYEIQLTSELEKRKMKINSKPILSMVGI